MNHSSSLHHSFDISLASMYGVECAILIHHFQHWIRINQFQKRNIRQGRCWSFQTRKDIQANFPYWSVDEVRRLTDKLVQLGVLVKGNFNKSKIDKTIWYAFANEEAFQVDAYNSKLVYERRNRQSIDKTATPIPDTRTEDTKAKKREERERAQSRREERAAKAALSPDFLHFDSVHLRHSDHAALLNELGETKLIQMIKELDEYSKVDPEAFKRYGCHATVIRRWVRREEDHNKYVEGIKTTHSKWWRNILLKIGTHTEIETTQDAVSFSYGTKYLLFKFTDSEFKAKTREQLRKMKLLHEEGE